MILRLPRPLVIMKTKRGTMYEWVMGVRQRPTSTQVSNQNTPPSAMMMLNKNECTIVIVE